MFLFECKDRNSDLDYKPFIYLCIAMTPYVNIHSHREGGPGTITVVSYRLGSGAPTPPAPFSAGIHPWDTAAAIDLCPEYDYLKRADIIAVGEIGLDRLKGADIDCQREIFAAQLEIAARRGLPVIIHCVRAFGEVAALLKQFPSVRAVFHGYTGSVEQTVQLILSGHYVSLGEVSLRSAKTIRAAKAVVPPERLFLETDDSLTAIEKIYDTASRELGIPPERLKEQIYSNYQTLFEGK